MNHFFQTIQGWFSFKDCYLDAIKQAPDTEESIFVEIGSWKGRSTAFMGVEIINSRKPIKFYAVDTWLGSDEPAHKKDPDIIHGTLFKTFSKNLASLIKTEAVHPMRMPSVNAAQYFKDGTVDFLFIDGGHTYEDVKADLKAWMPKMKPNGVVAGDDYNWTGVKKAIFERFGEENIEVLGEGKGRHWRVRRQVQSKAA